MNRTLLDVNKIMISKIFYFKAPKLDFGPVDNFCDSVVNDILIVTEKHISCLCCVQLLNRVHL